MSYLGIRGFESILRGGIPQRAEVLMLTQEGVERHLLGAHWVVEGLGRGERVLAVIAGEDPETFLARLGRMGIDTSAALASGVLVIVDWFTCWTQAVEGVQEVNRTFRAARRPEDLVGAIDRAIPALFAAEGRRAYIDVLPLAYKALEEVQVIDLLSSIRGVLSEAGVTAMFAADRGLPSGRIDTLLQVFHAVLDARGEEPEVLGIAVLGVGGVKLAPRYRRVRVREDGAALDAQPGTRTFSCPICDARVPFDAERCPSCGTVRSDMGTKLGQLGLMTYLESLRGKEAAPGRVSVPSSGKAPPLGLTNGVPPSGRAPGRVNGTASGRVNGTAPGRVNGTAAGRVNGVAPKGRTNGLAAAKGMVNGTRGGTVGITNGLTNGLVRARTGITNGLTNGSGFTNGLGSRRARSETRHARWKLYLVPLLAAGLLVSPLLLPEAAPRPAHAVDGDFSDWQGVPGYTQAAGSDVNPSVALTAYKVRLAANLSSEPDALYLYGAVAGSWFSDTNTVDSLYVFLQTSGSGGTGYQVPGFAADMMASVQGNSEGVSTSTLQAFSGADPDNWTAWAPTGESVALAFSAGNLEMSIPWAPAQWGTNPSILLMADDGRGNRSYSLAFSPSPGALRAAVRGLTDRVSQDTEEFIAVDVEAFGGPVTISSLQIDVTGGIAVLPSLPVTLQTGDPQTLIVRVDASGSSLGTLITGSIQAINADRPVLLSGGPVRAYVGAAPAGKTVDGWFGDWVGDWGPELELQNDSDPGVLEADRNIDRYAANRTGTTLYLYVDVNAKGTILAGTPIPIRRTKWEPGSGPASTAPLVPMRNAGVDVLRVYIDTNRDVVGGTPILGLRGADLMLEIDGIHGQITKRTAFQWEGGWQPLPGPPAVNDERRLEASLAVPATGAVEVVYETMGWQGPGDTTNVSGTRGVRAARDGGYTYEGRFTATFGPDGRVEVAAGQAQFAWTLLDPYTNGAPSGGWTLEPTPVGVRYSRVGAEVRYRIDSSGVKEDIVLASPDLPAELVFPIEWGNRTLFWEEPGQPIGIYGGQTHVFDLAAPFAIDALGAVTPLALSTDLAAHEMRIALPQSLRSAAYPLTIDPSLQYALYDNGSTYKVGENLGFSVAIGDFNGDGYADVLAGAPFWGYTNHTNVGYAYMYFGPFNSTRAAPDVRINGTIINNGRFGYSVAAGKFHSGSCGSCWDALIAHVSTTTPIEALGPVDIFFGSTTLSGDVSTPDVTIEPPNSPASFGLAVAAGNIDNAFYDDVLIGEPGRNNGGGNSDGLVYLYRSPFSSNVTSANYTLFPSTNSTGQLGKAIAVGKIDSDAYPDIVAGEPAYVAGCGGRFQFYKGIQFVSGSGNRYPNATISAPSTGCGSNAWQLGSSLAAGRLNGDNYADVLVGAPTKGNSTDGIAYIYLAKDDGSGLSSGASADVTLSGQASGERFGWSVAIGDWTGDGTADAFVGAYLAPGSGGSPSSAGRMYWFNNPLVDQTVDDTIYGTKINERLGNSLAVGKFSADARMVLAVGAPNWPKSGAQNDGRIIVATIPEPLPLMLVAAVVPPLVFRARSSRRRRVPRARGL